MDARRVVCIATLCGAVLGLSTTRPWAGCGSRPGTPNNLVARNTAPGQIILNWHPTGGEMCYDVEVKRDGQVMPQSSSGDYCNQTSALFRNLAYDHNYCFRIRARDGIGTEGCVSELYSNTACAGTSNPPFTK